MPAAWKMDAEQRSATVDRAGFHWPVNEKTEQECPAAEVLALSRHVLRNRVSVPFWAAPPLAWKSFSQDRLGRSTGFFGAWRPKAIDSSGVIRASQSGHSRIAFESMGFKNASIGRGRKDKKIKKRLTRLHAQRGRADDPDGFISSRKHLFFHIFFCFRQRAEQAANAARRGPREVGENPESENPAV